MDSVRFSSHNSQTSKSNAVIAAVERHLFRHLRQGPVEIGSRSSGKILCPKPKTRKKRPGNRRRKLRSKRRRQSAPNAKRTGLISRAHCRRRAGVAVRREGGCCRCRVCAVTGQLPPRIAGRLAPGCGAKRAWKNLSLRCVVAERVSVSSGAASRRPLHRRMGCFRRTLI